MQRLTCLHLCLHFDTKKIPPSIGWSELHVKKRQTAVWLRVMIGDTMTLLSLLGRIMRYFLLRPETLFLLCISLALWSYFFHTDEVKTIFTASRLDLTMVFTSSVWKK